MQGKEASEQETQKCTAGIDVSKDWLDAHVLPLSEFLRVANDTAGIRQLKRWLLRRKVELIAIEATGKWHREAFRSLSASFAVAVINPYRARLFAQVHGILAKTDRLDAKVLAMFAAMMSPSCRPPTPRTIEAIQEFVTARASAADEAAMLKNPARGRQRALSQTSARSADQATRYPHRDPRERVYSAHQCR